MIIEKKSYAKINLTLEIIKKREDGYHDINSIFQLIELHDNLTFEFNNSEKIEVISNDPNVPNNENNLCYKAAQLILNKTNQKIGVKIFLDKKIPTQAGLGGGSSNAAVTLISLNNIIDNPLEGDQLLAIGKHIGSDIPFFLSKQKTVYIQGVGDIMEPLKDLPQCKLLLIFPITKIDTKKAYSNLNLTELKLSGEYSTLLKTAINYNSFFEAKKYIHNDFEKSVFKQNPELGLIKKHLENESKAASVTMSGSGSTIFCLFKDEQDLNIAFDKFSKIYKCVITNTL